MIPFVDLKAQYVSIKKEIDNAIENVIRDTAFVGGSGNKYNQEFEKVFAAYIGTKYCVGCGNGTDAIEIIVKALGLGPGDEVIVPALTWIATSEAVSSCGATPVFVDVDQTTYTIDTKKIKRAITTKTKAIIPVHLYGLPADMDEITKIAKTHSLLIIEDCAQAHGAEYKGKKVGTFGVAATFSFFPGKNLGGYGDAGAIVTNDEGLAIKTRMLANHGMLKRHEHEFEGRNSRLDGLQAAILSVKLKHLDKWNNNRIKNAALYDKYIISNIITPKTPDHHKHVYHLYVIQSQNRDRLKEKLKEEEIEASIHYPTALPYLKCYQHLRYTEKDFPIAYSLSKKILSLPMFPELTEEQIKCVTKIINNEN